MGCCVSTGVDSEHNRLVMSILKSNPVSLCSIKHIKSTIKMNTDVSPKKIDSRSSNNLVCVRKQELEHSESNYIKTIYSLFKVKINDFKSSPVRKKNSRLSSRSTIIRMMSYKESKDGSQYLDIAFDSQDTAISFAEEDQTQLSRLYAAIIPTYSELSDAILKDKPESSFFLFIIGLCKDTIEYKCKLFIELCENTGQKLNLKLFRSIIQSYIDLNISFNFKIYGEIILIKSNSLIKEIHSQFDIRLSNELLQIWEENNIQLSAKRSSLVTRICYYFCKELINLLYSETTHHSLNEYKLKHRAKLDNATTEDLDDLIEKNKYAKIEHEHIVLLNNLYPFLFNSNELFGWISNW